ncbi:MAG TPA: beta-eliminating lyase-related protein [Pyrinomonadaceae bacterium]|jgi:threonine aldolase|nr:beta-eliminating lyase-related protein [Pyrinomonadaceae bacterium]
MAHKYLFFDDYSEGAHPRILDALARTNLQQEPGYVMDSFAIEAREFIRQRFGVPDADVHFVSSGTQANLVVLSAMLKPYESVIAADSGHINQHETGAIEATGHKINTVLGDQGKIRPNEIDDVLEAHNFDQMVLPRAVYVSQSTELGTVYTKAELSALSAKCKERGLDLYVDGARLGAALTSAACDLDPETLAQLVDVFYVGGTKNGALIGEAIVIVNPALKANFRFNLRQRGALLAKARAVSIQFQELFRDSLYFDIARHANDMAQLLAQGIRDCGYEIFVEAPTNQVFPIFSEAVIQRLQQDYGFHVWEKFDQQSSVVRLVTSWATEESAVDEFLRALKACR